MPTPNPVAQLVDTIPQSQEKTEFFNALTEAIGLLNAADADERVIVLMSDGEDTSPEAGNEYQSGSDPNALLTDFKAKGGIVIVLGTRASDGGFALLSAFSTGGFFINGYPANEADALSFLSGLKGYVCAGNCTPAGDEIVGEGVLDYNVDHSFINWNVTGGKVDLIGNGFFDFLPGNGLYVDLMGSSPPANGRMVSKASYALQAGHTYRLSVTLAGNQRLDTTPYSAELKVFTTDGTTETALLSQVVVINNYAQPFTAYSFSFVPTTDVAAAFISIQEKETPPGLTGVKPYFGLLLGSVKFDDMTDFVNLLNDNFDGENQQYIPPRCGPGTVWTSIGYQSGTNCYGEGCLTTPPPTQLPDPQPLSDIESGYTPPVQYNSTQKACASCGTGTIAVIASQTLSQAIGISIVDLGSAQQPDYYGITIGGPVGQFPTVDFTLQASNDQLTWVNLDIQPSVTNTGTLMVFPTNAGAAYRYYKVPEFVVTSSYYGTLNLYLSTAYQVCKTAPGTSTVSQADADQKAYAAALALAQAALVCSPSYTATEQYTARCPLGNGPDVTKSATYSSLVSLADAEAKALAAATVAAQNALVCQSSNNDQTITIPAFTGSMTKANPYPSVKQVSAPLTPIQSVQVTLKGLSHSTLAAFEVVLVGPDGTGVILMQFGTPGTTMNVGVNNINLVFDDTGAAFVSNTAPVSNTLYKPYAFAPISIGLPAPYNGPNSPATHLSAFNGKNANGAWALWIVADGYPLSSGQIVQGWDLTIGF